MRSTTSSGLPARCGRGPLPGSRRAARAHRAGREPDAVRRRYGDRRACEGRARDARRRAPYARDAAPSRTRSTKVREATSRWRCPDLMSRIGASHRSTSRLRAGAVESHGVSFAVAKQRVGRELASTARDSSSWSGSPFDGHLRAFAVRPRKDGVCRAENPTCVSRAVPPRSDRAAAPGPHPERAG
jgi:hypothetical protein